MIATWQFKRRTVLLVPSVFAAAIVACGISGAATARTRAAAEATSARTSPAGTLVVNASTAPASLDIHSTAYDFSDDWPGNFYTHLTYHPPKPGPSRDVWGRPLKDGLHVTVMDTTRVVPYLATWRISDGGKVYTLQINPNAKFPDGHPITSEDVKFSIERTLKLGAGGSYFFIAGQYDNQPKISTPNPHVAILRFSRPESDLLFGWATAPAAIYERSAVLTHPDKPHQPVNPYWASHIAGGGGPFNLQQYEPNKLLTLTRNSSFFAPSTVPAPQADKIIVNFIGDESTLLLQARSGAADVTLGLAPDSIQSLKNNPNVNVIEVPAFQHWDVNLNWNNAPTNNAQFRAALTYAVPYQQILSSVAGGFGSLYYGPIAQNLRYFNRKLEQPRAFDLAKAQSLLAASGVQTPVDVTMVIQQGNALTQQIATILQNVWQQIGVNLTVTPLSPVDYNNAYPKADMSIRLDGPGAPDPAWLLGYDMKCGYAYNASHICIPEADKLLLKARTSTSSSEQQILYNRITKLWRAQSPKIILFGVNQVIVLNKRVKAYHWNINTAQMERWH